MAYKATQSSFVGFATMADGGRGRAYRALVPLMCGDCGRPIPPGHLFSRHAPRNRTTGKMAPSFSPMSPICADCRPLRLDDAAG